MEPVSVAIVNDYPLVVAGLARLLEPFSDRVVVVDAEAGGTPSRPVDVALARERGPEIRDTLAFVEQVRRAREALQS